MKSKSDTMGKKLSFIRFIGLRMTSQSLFAGGSLRALFVIACALIAFSSSPVLANDRSLDLRSDPTDPFTTPAAMRGRVDFWVDIFSRHGKFEVVMHHRNFPQAIFGRFDFRAEGERLSEDAYRKFRKETLEAQSARVLSAMRKLATGDDPSSDFERRIERAMKLIPGNLMENYRQVLADPELIRTQTGVRDRHALAIRRAGRYLPAIERIFVQEYRLPVELTRLPFIESSFDYEAYSSVGAAGIWQFMRRTGLQYLTINKAVDERRDPIRATHAAAQYLRAAYDRFGLWPLALTSYNHGKGGVAKRVRDYGTTDIVQLVERNWEKRPFGFASGNFYAAFLSAVEIWDRRAELFPEVTPESPAQYQIAPVTKASSISRLAQLHSTNVDDLRQLNYALTESVWRGKLLVPAGYKLRLPKTAVVRGAVLEAGADTGRRSADVSEQPRRSGDAASRADAASREFAVANYRVRKGDTLAAIAKRYRVPLQALIEANGNSEDIHAGQMLSIPRVQPEPSRAKKSVDPVEYVVQSGDTLHSIAKRNKVSVGKLREWNRLNSTRIVVGQRLIVKKS